MKNSDNKTKHGLLLKLANAKGQDKVLLHEKMCHRKYK